MTVRSLGLIGDHQAAEPVLDAVPAHGSRIGVPAWVAAEALLGMGLGVAPVLRRALASEDADVRDVAVTVAGAATFSSLRPQLRVLLEHDPSPEVRTGAAVALGRVGAPQDVAALVRHTAPRPAPLRRTCVAALGELGDPAAVPALSRLLDEEDRRLAELSAEALVRVGEPAPRSWRCACAPGPGRRGPWRTGHGAAARPAAAGERLMAGLWSGGEDGCAASSRG